jgi:hypothetical protein
MQTQSLDKPHMRALAALLGQTTEVGTVRFEGFRTHLAKPIAVIQLPQPEWLQIQYENTLSKKGSDQTKRQNVAITQSSAEKIEAVKKEVESMISAVITSKQNFGRLYCYAKKKFRCDFVVIHIKTDQGRTLTLRTSLIRMEQAVSQFHN